MGPKQGLEGNGWTLFTRKGLLSWMSFLMFLYIDSENDFEHYLQVNGISPECILRWVLQLPELKNYFENCLQINGFSPAHIRISLRLWTFEAYGFSTEYVLRLLATVNEMEHSLQVNGFSPGCILRWFLRWVGWWNDFEHSLQVNGFCPECVLFIPMLKTHWIWSYLVPCAK